MIELTDQQRQMLQAERGKLIDVFDPVTQQRYVLLASDLYERVRPLLESGGEPAKAAGVPPGVLRSQQAFWRDLPELLRNKGDLGQWVAYHGDERVGIGAYEDLMRECIRRGLPQGEYDLDVIEPRDLPPWEAEEIEPGGHELDDVEDRPGRVGPAR